MKVSCYLGNDLLYSEELVSKEGIYLEGFVLEHPLDVDIARFMNVFCPWRQYNVV